MRYVNNAQFAPANFDLLYFCLLLLWTQLDQNKSSTNWKTKNRSTTVYMICSNNDLLQREMLPRMKSGKVALNSCVVIFGKAQTDEDGIIQCAILMSNFSIWDKLLHYSVGKLQQENYNSL